jgi:amino acid permease
MIHRVLGIMLNILFTLGYGENNYYASPFVLITIAFILSHILQCSGQQSCRQVSFIELQAKHQSSLGGVAWNDDDMLSDLRCII